MPGHIKLGSVGALRDYMIQNLNLYSKSPANQFAAKLSTGGGNYDDLQNWSYFVMDDWRAGVGKKDPEGGGFLYGELETRYPNRLTLPNAIHLANQESVSYPQNYGYQPGKDLYPDNTITIGLEQTIEKVAHQVSGTANATNTLYVSLWLPHGNQEVTVTAYSDDGGSPGVPSAALSFGGFEIGTTIITEDRPGHGLYTCKLEYAGNFQADTLYHIVIEPTTTDDLLVLPINTLAAESTDCFSTYNGTSWSNYTGGAFLHGVMFCNDSNLVTEAVRFNGKQYIVNAGYLWVKDSDSVDWDVLAPFNITDICVVGNELWIAKGTASNMTFMDTAESETDSGVQADFLLVANGYVWRSLGGDVYYTADGSTWTGPIAVTWNGFEVRSMASLNDYLYCSTDDGLYYVGFGDIVGYITSWPTIDSTNGVGMINHQGNLFIPVQQSLYRYDGTTMLPIGIDQGEGLPQNRLGLVKWLISLNNWLVAIVATVESDNPSTVWAYNDQGWHHLATIPSGSGAVVAGGYNVTDRALYVGGSSGQIWRLPIADSANFNNISAYPTPKMPGGWLETDWFFGNLLEVQKDCESIYVTGDGLDSTHTVKVYWKDDDSTEWELLGTVDSGRKELRFDDYTTRPDTRQIKLGFLLETDDDDAPIVRGIRLKYHPMVSDWFRWSFPLLLSDGQELLGGEINIYTREEMEAHLDSLIKQVPPFIFEDLSGVQYEVKLMGCQVQLMDYEYLYDGPDYNLIYMMTIEQIRPDEYA